jgi:hypothetical protein
MDAIYRALSFSILCSAIFGGCATGEPTPPRTTVTPSKVLAGGYHFEVWLGGDPPEASYHAAPGSDELKEPVFVQIPKIMNRYAADYLKQRGLCERGVIGPTMVLVPERNRLLSFFDVKCQE